MKQKGLKLQSMKEKASITDKILFLVILLTGIVLRFYNYGHIPFVHDEISTLFRTHSSDSLGQLIAKASKSDVHPPGLVIFIHYWSTLFGDSAQAIKLPFIIAGLLSILIAYKVAGQLFNQTTALLTAVILSTSEYVTNYNIIARPYAFGMLFALLLIYCQWNFFTRNRQKNLWLAGLIISGIICTYLHYFSLLFTFITVIIGFFICPKEKIKVYLISTIIIAASFAPFIPILLQHVDLAIVEKSWIGKPNLGFIARYFFYICHYSWWLFSVVALILFVLYFRSSGKNTPEWNKRKCIALILFAAPFTIGYLISISLFPVLEFSGLIFGFAFLPMFLFSSDQELNPKMKIIVVSGLLIVSTLTLIFERKHFALFYNQGIDKLKTEIQSTEQLIGRNSSDYFINAENYFTNYYSTKMTGLIDVKIFSAATSEHVNQFNKALLQLNKKYIAFGTVTTFPTEILAVIQKQYPYLVKKYTGFLTEFYLFSKEKPTHLIDETIFSSEINFTSVPPGSTTLFTMPLKDIMKNYSDIVTVSMNILSDAPDTTSTLELVTEYEGRPLDKKSVLIRDYAQLGNWSDVYLSVRLTDISIKFKKADLKLIFRNAQGVPIKISDARLMVKKGNPYLYGQSFH
jgi:hypothetical protein